MRSILPDFRGGNRRVVGRVSSAGVVLSGAGFTAKRNGVGNYTVTFNPPFNFPPIVIVGSDDGANGAQNGPSTYTPDGTGFQVQMGANPGGNADRQFVFSAEGK